MNVQQFVVETEKTLGSMDPSECAAVCRRNRKDLSGSLLKFLLLFLLFLVLFFCEILA